MTPKKPGLPVDELLIEVLHGRNNIFFPCEQMFFLIQNIFIVPAMQHGCRAKPL